MQLFIFTMSNIISHFSNNTQITFQRQEDGYINATALCKSVGREFHTWNRSKSTIEFLQELSSDTQICGTELVQIQQGGEPHLQGTWVHPQVAINLAQWLSPKFAVQVSKWVQDWTTQKITPKQLSRMEILQLAIESEKRVLELENTVKEKEEVIEGQANIIDEFITISNTKNYTTVGKILHQKPLQFIQWLRDNKYIMQHREPYQQYLDMKLFVIKTPKTEQKHREPSYHITPKGFEYFRKKLVQKPAELKK